MRYIRRFLGIWSLSGEVGRSWSNSRGTSSVLGPLIVSSVGKLGGFLLFLGKSGVIRWPNCCDLGFSAILRRALCSLWLGSLGFRTTGALLQTSPHNVDRLILENFSP